MNQLIPTIQIILGIILVGLVLLQSKGTGLGTAFGGDMGFYGTKRGAEKIIFIFTLFIAFVFMVVSILSLKF